MMDIYQLAVQYLIPRLEQVCIQYLEFKISKQNVLDALFNADKMRYKTSLSRFLTIVTAHLLFQFEIDQRILSWLHRQRRKFL